MTKTATIAVDVSLPAGKYVIYTTANDGIESQKILGFIVISGKIYSSEYGDEYA